MTSNEAQRARDEYMSNPAGDTMSQIHATNALFVLVTDLQKSVAFRDEQIADLKMLVSSLHKRVAELEVETFGYVR